ncbi:hypothetical protein M427DRAFT_47242 [Gonapodya prolifera JEL478]|uniref:Uncharacterized protein n=1 Tax=Gonapodya prolifera (strain JEL478) TaxID=1344416 RepID=A0A139A3N5_GONPJ|nr:hypothetical protein M427DRAFT_47242 [Gonapodya prolifera JEL478]|eukprot:KXS11391.1 hypothetical protein M427DRAFT_47242 [Gonapodya prolifera JEL478]
MSPKHDSKSAPKYSDKGVDKQNFELSIVNKNARRGVEGSFGDGVGRQGGELFWETRRGERGSEGNIESAKGIRYDEFMGVPSHRVVMVKWMFQISWGSLTSRQARLIGGNGAYRWEMVVEGEGGAVEGVKRNRRADSVPSACCPRFCDAILTFGGLDDLYWWKKEGPASKMAHALAFVCAVSVALIENCIRFLTESIAISFSRSHYLWCCTCHRATKVPHKHSFWHRVSRAPTSDRPPATSISARCSVLRPTEYLARSPTTGGDITPHKTATRREEISSHGNRSEAVRGVQWACRWPKSGWQARRWPGDGEGGGRSVTMVPASHPSQPSHHLTGFVWCFVACGA